MMRNIKSITRKEIFLFDDTHKSHRFNNSLKEFIYYLRFNNIKGVIDFTYASHSDSIHPQLSIKDNFLLDSIPTSLIKKKEDNLQHNIEMLNNDTLVELIEFLNPLDRISHELTNEEVKIASIVKALMAQTKYIFLERPDKDLSLDMLNKVKECLRCEVEENNRIVFLKADNNDSWLDMATDVITRNENREYQKHANMLSAINNNQTTDFTPTYNFALHKKAI
jgi:ABC-type branched-subunit amino acid transport system ATPase component